MNDNRKTERTIDFAEMLKKAMERWRIIVIVVLACAIIFPLFLSIRAIDEKSGLIESAADKQTKMKSVEDALLKYTQFKLLSDYYSSSFLSGYDLSSANMASAQYKFSVNHDDISSTAVEEIVTNIFRDKEFSSAIASIYEIGIEPSSIYDFFIIDTAKGGGDKDDDFVIMTVNALLPQDVNAEDWSAFLTEAINHYCEKSFGDTVSSIKQLTLSNLSATPSDTKLFRDKLEDDMQYYYDSFQGAYNSLSDTNQNIADQIIKEIDGNASSFSIQKIHERTSAVWEHDYSLSNIMTVSLRNSFVIKNIVFGVISGLFLCIVIGFLKEVINKRITSIGQLKGLISARCFGCVYEYPYHGVFTRFSHDRRIYDRYHKGSQPERIIADLATKLEHMGNTDIVFVVLSNSSGRFIEIVDSQIQELKNKGIDVKRMIFDGSASEVEDSSVIGIKNAFMVIRGNDTDQEMIWEIQRKFEEYGIMIIGAEYIEAL